MIRDRRLIPLLSPLLVADMWRMDIETDVDTLLAREADRLRVIAFALRGLAHDPGAAVEPKVLHASAGELEAVARGLDALCEARY
ncbi:MAG: hypothetical protein HY716_16310 [Planctomycetes bacterium]|nr:hypothetical protein [Planctomycetota bacterium]